MSTNMAMITVTATQTTSTNTIDPTIMMTPTNRPSQKVSSKSPRKFSTEKRSIKLKSMNRFASTSPELIDLPSE